MNTIENYIGKIITSFKFTKQLLTFQFTDDSFLNLYAVGDCCSNSWFEGISGEEVLKSGNTLTSFNFVKLSEIDTQTGKLLDRNEDIWDNVTIFYGIKLTTNKGYCDIDMRNSSNGFYGGFITINDSDPYSEYTLKPDSMIRITMQSNKI